jgi:hypothetical protein
MKLKGKRSQLGANYDESIGCFTDSYMLQCKGGGGTTTTEPSEEQRAILDKQLEFANKMEGLGSQQFYGGNTLADMSRYTSEGLKSQLGAAGAAGNISDLAAGRFQSAMEYDPLQDPQNQAYLDAITAPLTEQFTEETLPALTTQAMQQGAYGGDRAALLKAEAAGDYMGKMAQTRSQALQDIVTSNRQLQADMLRQVPTLQDAALQPSQILRDVGAGYEGRSQAEIDAARERFEFGQEAPRQALRDASSMLSGIDFGSVTKTTGGGK